MSDKAGPLKCSKCGTEFLDVEIFGMMPHVCTEKKEVKSE